MYSFLDEEMLLSLDEIQQKLTVKPINSPSTTVWGCGCSGSCGQSCAGDCDTGCSGDCGRSCSGSHS